MNTPIKSPTSNLQENPSLRTATPAQTKKQLPMKYIIGGIVALLLIIGGIVAFYLMNQNADTRQQAAGCSATQVQCTCGCKERAVWIKTAGGCSGLCGSSGGSTGGGSTGGTTNTCTGGCQAGSCSTKDQQPASGTCPNNGYCCKPKAGTGTPTCAQAGGSCQAGACLGPTFVSAGGTCTGGQFCCKSQGTTSGGGSTGGGNTGGGSTGGGSTTNTCTGGCQVGSCSTVDQQTATGRCPNNGYCCKPKAGSTPAGTSCISAGGSCQSNQCGTSQEGAGGTCTNGQYCCKPKTLTPGSTTPGTACVIGQTVCGTSAGCASGQGKVCNNTGSSGGAWTGCTPLTICTDSSNTNRTFLAPGSACVLNLNQVDSCRNCQYGDKDYKCNQPPAATCSGTCSKSGPCANGQGVGTCGGTDICCAKSITESVLPAGMPCVLTPTTAVNSCSRCVYGNADNNTTCDSASSNTALAAGSACLLSTDLLNVSCSNCPYGNKDDKPNLCDFPGLACDTGGAGKCQPTGPCQYGFSSGVCSGTQVCCAAATSAQTQATCTGTKGSCQPTGPCQYGFGTGTCSGTQVCCAKAPSSGGGTTVPISSTSPVTQTTTTGGTSGGGGGTSTPPVQSGPACVGMTMEGTGALNTSVTFTCANVAGTNHYEFRVKLPDGTFKTLTATGNKSASFTISTAGQYKAQCRSCTGAAASTCQAYETIGG